MLLSKTLRSSTFRLAILYVCLFGASVAGLFGYVYWSTTKYVKQRYDNLIVADRRALLDTFARFPTAVIIVSLVEATSVFIRHVTTCSFKG